MTLPDLDSLNVTVTINIGDDTFTASRAACS
jgi:hypothetical protein